MNPLYCHFTFFQSTFFGGEITALFLWKGKGCFICLQLLYIIVRYNVLKLCVWVFSSKRIKSLYKTWLLSQTSQKYPIWNIFFHSFNRPLTIYKWERCFFCITYISSFGSRKSINPSFCYLFTTYKLQPMITLVLFYWILKPFKSARKDVTLVLLPPTI